MLMLLAKFEFDRWFHFSIYKELSEKTGFFSLKPDDVIVMSSNVYEWEGKPRPNAGYKCLMQQIMRKKINPMIVGQYCYLKINIKY